MSQLQRKKKQVQVDQSCSWMFEALILLLKKKSFFSISVSDIVKKAGVSRQTFYRHFKSKEELIEWNTARIFKIYVGQINSFDEYDLRKDLMTYFEVLEKEAEVLKALFKAGLECIILTQISDYSYHLESVSRYDNEKILRYVSGYFAGGIFMIMRQWICEGLVETPEELVDIILNRCMESAVYCDNRSSLLL